MALQCSQMASFYPCFAIPFNPILQPAPPRPLGRRRRVSHEVRTLRMDTKDSFRSNPNPLSLHQSNEIETPMTGMKVTFMAAADEFAMPSLYRRLLRSRSAYGGVKVSATGSVICMSKRRTDGQGRAEAFVFAYGCLVVWGSQDDADDFISLVAEDAIELRRVPAVDTMEYQHGKTGGLKHDVITLQSPQEIDGKNVTQNGTGQGQLDPSLELLAISCGLAQSIKLGAFESAMRMTIENTRHLPEELAETGRITASRREVSRLMGRLFLDRYLYHLSSDLLMTPAFFWENEEYLPFYRRVERYLEVRERGEVLNKRVEVVQELYKLLGDELSHQNSAALELAITVMIAFEILLTLLTLARENVKSMFSACALFVCLSAIGWALWVIYRRRRASQTVNKFSRPQNGLLSEFDPR